MSASSRTASSNLSHGRAAVIVLTSIAAIYGTYYVYSSRNPAGFIVENEARPGSALHRSNAVHRRRRRDTQNTDDPNALFVDEDIENSGDGRAIAPVTLTDGETVVDDAFDDDSYRYNEPPATYTRSGQNIVQLLFRVSEDATRRNAYVHRGCACNSCGAVPIRGIRYRCSNCADYDLCESCESQGLHIKTHIFYKIRVPGPSFGPKNIQPVWYAGDPDSVMRTLPKEITTKLARETGFERPELDAYWEQWTFMASTDWRDDPYDINLAMDRKTFERCLVPSGGYRHTSPSLIFDRMFAFYDTNKDDLIGFPEFLHGIGYRKKKDKWARIFEGYDIDGDGFVERKDFLRMFRSYYVLFRQMHRDMLEGMEEQHMACTEAHRLVTSRQPLSSAFGLDGRYPRAPDPRTGEGKTAMSNGDLEITDGKGVTEENSGDTGARELVFKTNTMTLGRYHQQLRESTRIGNRPRNRNDGGYWETIMDPPQTEVQANRVFRNMRRFREMAEDVLQGQIRADRHSHDSALNYPDGLSETDEEEAADANVDLSWIPSYATDEDAEAIDGPGTRLVDVLESSRRMVITHAHYRERAEREIFERWQRRQFFTDEEEGAVPPRGWKEEDDILANATGESSKSQPRPSMHSRSSSKVRFAEDMDDFDTRSNPSTSSRSVPERWGGMDIPDAEKDAGKEILYQVTQQSFNELLDPLFKEKEKSAVLAVKCKDARDIYRPLFTTPTFESWARERQAREKRERDSPLKSPPERSHAWAGFPEVDLDEIRQLPVEELLNEAGFSVVDETSAAPGPRESGVIRVDEEENLIDEDGGIPYADRNDHEDGRDGSSGRVEMRRAGSPYPRRPRSGSHPSTPAEVLAASSNPFMLEEEAESMTSSLPQSTPAGSNEESRSSSPSYHDPTLPQFRPNSMSSVPTPYFSRFAEDLPEVDGEEFTSPQDQQSLRQRESKRSTSKPASKTNGKSSKFSESKASNDGRPSDEILYSLWIAEQTALDAERKGGYGKLDFAEFEATVKKFVKEGKANRMEYLGSWIDLCIPP
ncbi:hypothetical protein HYFRA_00006353 [Hymenoscyphus fraxineus]|uniref:Uncharacterized protein n=1 Tax=Hymenoscyphus fraxineus TaxID=746836 RepID=A0A9N9KPW6_9HELO|nr:hypothetical protein HYFRA_00006353 [Hymenoscyphus fraxineus]